MRRGAGVEAAWRRWRGGGLNGRGSTDRPGTTGSTPSGGLVVQPNVMECPGRVRSAGCTARRSRATRHLDTRADYSKRRHGATRGRGSTRARSGPASVSLRAPPSLSNFGPGPRGPRRTRGRCLRDIASSPARRRGDDVTACVYSRNPTPSSGRSQKRTQKKTVVGLVLL